MIDELVDCKVDGNADKDLQCLSASSRPLEIPTATLQHMLRYDLFFILYPTS